MVELIRPDAGLRAAWLDAREDWGRGVHQDGAGLRPGDDVDSEAGFEAWIERLDAEASADMPFPDGMVPCSYWWIVEDQQVLGAIALRHELNAFLLEAGGHVGYGVRPTARRRGLATWALGEVLIDARRRGLERVLITCDVDNDASRRTIESHGGQLEDIRDTQLGRLRRYWVDLEPSDR